MTNEQVERLVCAFERIGEALSVISQGYAAERASISGVGDEDGGYFVLTFQAKTANPKDFPDETTLPIDYNTMTRLVQRSLRKSGMVVIVFYRPPNDMDWFLGFETGNEAEATTFLVEWAKTPPWAEDQALEDGDPTEQESKEEGLAT